MYKVASPPPGGLESSCWGRKSSGEKGKGIKKKGREGKENGRRRGEGKSKER